MTDEITAETPAEAMPQATAAQKPPTQTFSPEGSDFNSVAVKQKAARDGLGRLPEHPPFQMFIEEAEPNQACINSVQYAAERSVAAIGRMGAEPFIASYVDWWEKKGYWNGESPFGGSAGQT